MTDFIVFLYISYAWWTQYVLELAVGGQPHCSSNQFLFFSKWQKYEIYGCVVRRF